LIGDLLGGRGRGGGGGGRGGGGRPSGGGGIGGSRPAVGGGGARAGDRGGGLGTGGPGVGGGGARPGGGGPGVGGGGPGPGTRPSQGDLGKFLNIGGPGAGPGIGGKPGVGGGPGIGAGGAAGDFFRGPGAGAPGLGKGGGPGPGVGKGAGKIGQLPSNRPSRIENRQQYSQNRQDRRQEVRDQFRDNHPRFDFAMEHPRWAAWRVNAPYRWATVAALTAWCGYGAASYYDWGENIYYQDGNVYSEGQIVATVEKHDATAEQYATNIPEVKNPEWMPLGVFAITKDGEASGPAPTLFVHLTVSKEGIIAGTFQNTALEKSQPLEGMVDKNSQRAAWVVSGTKRPLMEVGIFNLTKDTAPALVHYENAQVQQMLLIRMDEPKK
jgi:hypothetical protein